MVHLARDAHGPAAYVAPLTSHAAAAAEIVAMRNLARQLQAQLARAVAHLPHGSTVRRDAMDTIRRADALL